MANAEKVGARLVCNVCGNEVTLDVVGGGEIICCGESMEVIKGSEEKK